VSELIDIHDYLIDQSKKDWANLLLGYAEVLPSSFTVWMVNRLGDVIAVFEDGSVHLLDTGNCIISRVASSRDEFCTLIDLDDNAEGWLMISIVDQCRESGMHLSENQCYGFKVPPILGGKYEIENMEPTDLSVHYSFLADIYRQTRDLPDGTKIRVVVTEPPATA
jgi:hypothetical protein